MAHVSVGDIEYTVDPLRTPIVDLGNLRCSRIGIGIGFLGF